MTGRYELPMHNRVPQLAPCQNKSYTLAPSRFSFDHLHPHLQLVFLVHVSFGALPINRAGLGLILNPSYHIFTSPLLSHVSALHFKNVYRPP